MNKRYTGVIASLAVCGMMAGLTGCSDDKQMTLDGTEVIIPTSITFECTETLPLAVGMDSLLVYTVGPEEAEDKSLLFRSGDESIATVDENGLVHAVAVGETTISAVPKRLGAGTTASIFVQVIPEITKATSIDVESETPPSDEGKYYVTDEIQLSNTIYPEDVTYHRVAWVSSNPEIASVDETGKVTLLKEGDVEIYCVAQDRSGVRGEFKVHVDPYIEIQSLTINSQLQDLSLPSDGIRLDVTYTPANGTAGSVQWESNNEAVATVNRGVVTPVGFGSAVITATCTATGQTATIEVTVANGKYFWNGANGFRGWICSNDQADEERTADYWRVFFPDPGTGKWRRDIKLDLSKGNHVWHSDYPVYAIKTNLQKGGNNTFDIRDAGSPKDNNGTELSDGTRLIMWDPTGKWTGFHEFNLFQVKIADIPNENVDKSQPYYDIFWIGSFKNKQEAIDFAENEIKNKK